MLEEIKKISQTDDFQDPPGYFRETYEEGHEQAGRCLTRRRLFDSGGATYSVDDLKDEDRSFVRNAAFRRNVVKLYDQWCAFCKMRVVSWDGQNILDGAHIMPFSEFHNDLFVNGIALCKNHHWAFDRG